MLTCTRCSVTYPIGCGHYCANLTLSNEQLPDVLVNDWYEQMKPAPRWVPVIYADLRPGDQVRETWEGPWEIDDKGGGFLRDLPRYERLETP